MSKIISKSSLANTKVLAESIKTEVLTEHKSRSLRSVKRTGYNSRTALKFSKFLQDVEGTSRVLVWVHVLRSSQQYSVKQVCDKT